VEVQCPTCGELYYADHAHLAISIWKDDETKALAETLGAATLLDKANLATELIPAIKLNANA
jgi:hypothetical protein